MLPVKDAIGGKDLQSEKDNLTTLLWAWKVRFKKALRELDQVLRSLLVGLEKIGPSHKPARRKIETGL